MSVRPRDRPTFSHRANTRFGPRCSISEMPPIRKCGYLCAQHASLDIARAPDILSAMQFAPNSADPFWRHKTLDQLTPGQWESLCDGCGRCCLEKLKNPTTGKVYYTWVACPLLDGDTCRCTDYDLRHILIPDCIALRPDNIISLRWMPRTCAYRLVAEGKELPAWHPLISGDPESVHTAGISVRHRTISSRFVHPDDLENFCMKERP